MKASIRHVINPPSETSKSLHERIIHSISAAAAVIDNNDNDDDLFVSSSSPLSSKQNSTNIAITSPTSLNNTPTGGGGGKAYVNQNISVLKIHPVQPLLCYVDTNGHYDNITKKNKNIVLTFQQRLVIQNHLLKHTIAIISIMDIVQQYICQLKYTNNHNNANSAAANNTTVAITNQEIEKMAQQFGMITSIQFMDLHVLQYESGFSTPSVPSSSTTNKKNTHPSYIILHFKNRIILYPMSLIYKTTTATNTITTMSTNQIIEITNSALNKAGISCQQIIPIASTNLVTIGCSDGAIRFYSICDEKIVKSVRGPNGKNDPVVGIVSMNTWDSKIASPISSSSLSSPTAVGNGSDNEFNDREGGLTTCKIMTICASGTAYLWELQVSFHISTGCIEKFNLRPPLIKIDCFSYLSSVISSSLSSPSSSSTALNTSIMGSSSVSTSTFVQHNCDNVKFDSIRQLLFWTVQPTNNSSLSKSYVVVWDLSPASITLMQKSQRLSLKSTEKDTVPQTPLHLPQSIIQIPTGDFLLSDATMISGWMHSSFPSDAYTCLAVSRDGNLSLIASSCQPSEKSSSKKINTNAAIYHSYTFSSMKKTVDEKLLGVLRLINDEKLKITSIASSYARPDVIVMSSNVGLIVVTLDDEDVLVTGSIHSCFSSAKANSSGFIGAGNKVLLVKDSSVYMSSLDFSPSTSIPNPIGHLNYQDTVLIYRSPPAIHKSIEFQSRPMRIPPRLLPSPSGNFLCLFWHSENRYEIIHHSSISNASKKAASRDRDSEYSPAVDFGTNVLSFAWVGDEDIFALLCPPEMSRSDSGTPSSKKKVNDDDDNDDILDPAKFKPRVELKVLVGVIKDAVEFSSSVAAATATSLGTLPLRGRHPPNTLFGGPVLCVGSVSQDKKSSFMDGMSYFYCRNKDGNNRASFFTSVGPTLPYPDMVVWDDDGKICAMIIGRRVAIYLVNPPEFTLLGTVNLGTADESDTKVQSAKFLHGVLFCSTQTSVQCIFLGDIDNHNIICELDVFVLSSSSAAIDNIQSSIRPQPQSMPLIRPSILGYFHGSLLVSTVYGVQAISLDNPFLRIGSLLAAGHYTRAQQWFDAFDIHHHEVLANFLDRRGFPEMAIQLSGLSLETIIDYCLRYGFTDFLISTIESYGVETFHNIDMGRGVSGDGSYSIIICVGAYLLSQGKSDFVIHIANVCLSLGESGRKEAFTLGTLLIKKHPNEAKDIIERAITEYSPDCKPLVETWPLAMYIKNNIL